jgi:3-hydroxyacyl-CoA dehydrogenase
MKRLEIVRGPETSDDTLAAASAVGNRMGTEVVLVDERVATSQDLSI